MKYMTLREVCNDFGVSRRAVQGYEKANLVSASGKNERGYLLYDEDSQERIKRIKLFQQMGFTIKEIKELKRQAKKLERESCDIEVIITKIYDMMEILQKYMGAVILGQPSILYV